MAGGQSERAGGLARARPSQRIAQAWAGNRNGNKKPFGACRVPARPHAKTCREKPPKRGAFTPPPKGGFSFLDTMATISRCEKWSQPASQQGFRAFLLYLRFLMSG